ncbi:hypothetical protein [Pseudomonas fluorescens]
MHTEINATDWYHGSFDKIDSFEPFSHFGSLKAATDRLNKKRLDKSKAGETQEHIYKCSITISADEVLSVCTDWGSNRAQSLAAALMNCFPQIPEYKEAWESIKKCQDSEGTPERRKYQANEYGFPMLKKLLTSQGYKVLIYKNEVEDIGSYSLLVIDQNIIKLL